MKKHAIFIGRSLAVATSFFALLFPMTLAYALDALPSGAFIVRPAKIELAISPGSEKTTMLTLSNGTALPLSVRVSFEDVAPSMQSSPVDASIVLLGADGGSYPLKELFHTDNESIDILSGQEVQIPVTVRIPQRTEAGGKYGSVIFTFKPVLSHDVSSPANVAIESRLATLFYVRVLGNAKEEGQLVAFGLFNNANTARTPSADQPLRFQVAYENTGDVHVNPYGRLTLSPIIGAEKFVLIPPQAVLPGATHMREVDVSDALSIGYYRAHIELNRGYRDVVDEREISFWIVPGPEGTLLIILGSVFLVWLIRRSLQLSKHRIL
ncbi:MAG: hypothetical protein A2845_03590 [Candidatus Lloydbacteria bacterium RIFCSPHIGHO2_01_FULL_49_22]|uniref:Uncharacterized protein n=1 Tax=Candidatus Lloydbacteria bacterium RIFCSPHIGHO2_01_FULL_49_22 TaxID=1798658 RepID=A0A1G2CWS5_9BACT|nr:MAG: hypothetical protein A2845_03590 [Candidatus Lloydbacteria bacterium RIFCSPHIGHO2_01_FULL_49_22]OGZ09012.1 MAG: hypothetical protein A3C14_03425 [Candidatus Lloydbacteria bacterium RIFCSPHIGHO2_02_FULL_50_18]